MWTIAENVPHYSIDGDLVLALALNLDEAIPLAYSEDRRGVQTREQTV